MNGDDTLRFKVCVSSAVSDELYEDLKKRGPYYRSRRLLQLAQLGFALEKDLPVSTTLPSTIAEQPVSIDEPANPQQDRHYKISDGLKKEMLGMLDAVEGWGTA